MFAFLFPIAKIEKSNKSEYLGISCYYKPYVNKHWLLRSKQQEEKGVGSRQELSWAEHIYKLMAMENGNVSADLHIAPIRPPKLKIFPVLSFAFCFFQWENFRESEKREKGKGKSVASIILLIMIFLERVTCPNQAFYHEHSPISPIYRSIFFLPFSLLPSWYWLLSIVSL